MAETLMCSIGVGGWVVRDDGAVLLVRMTYGPAKGRLMMPGGHADAGEFLDQTAVREVREETGVEAVPVGILMIRQRIEPELRNLYLVLLMQPAGVADAVPDGTEVCETVWLRPETILARDDVQPIVRETAQAWLDTPDRCIARRAIAWRGEREYRLWVGG